MSVYLGDSKVLISRVGSEVVFIWSPSINIPRLTTSDGEQLLDSNGLYLITAESSISSFGGE